MKKYVRSMDKKEYNRVYRENHRKEAREYFREYRKIHGQKRNLNKMKEYNLQYRLNNPRIVQVKNWTNKNFDTGHICEICEEVENLIKHHMDYDYPFIFVTLCRSCHAWVHGRGFN